MFTLQRRTTSKRCQWLALGTAALITATTGLATASDHPNGHPEQQLNTAFDFAVSGDFNSAETALKNLLASHPNFNAALLLKAQVLQAKAGLTPAWHNAAPKAAALNDELALRWRHGSEHNDRFNNRIPEQLLQTSARYDRVLLVDTSEHRLYVINPQPQQMSEPPELLADYYVSIGKNGIGKRKSGDNRTPLGIYTIISAMNDNQLPELYGAAAFPIDYPNSWDRREKRSGSGIWVHGVPRTTYARTPEASRGCVALANDDLKALSPHITIGNTQVVIADSITWLSEGEYQRRRHQLLSALESWRRDWQKGELEPFMRHYATDFSNEEHQNKASWQQYRSNLVDSREKISVELSDLSLLAYPGEKDLVEARFQLSYSSKTSSAQRRKRQYWRKTDGRWQIVQEEADEGVTGIELAANIHDK